MKQKTIAETVKEVLKEIPIGKEFHILEVIRVVRNRLSFSHDYRVYTLDGTILAYMRKIRSNGKRLFECVDHEKSIYMKVAEAEVYHITQKRFSEMVG